MASRIAWLFALALLTVFGCWRIPAAASAAGTAAAARRPATLYSSLSSQQASCAAATTGDPTVVATSFGAIRGTSQGGVLTFKGVPYAAPPVGDLRWRNPAPHDCWTDARDANAFGNQCPQIRSASVVGDEDCLTLNVWAPQGAASNGALPVMFFLLGGGNVQGSTSEQLANGTYLYDGAVLAQKGNAVIVTANYRLGALGFLAHPALTADAGQTTHGNYGIMDQIAALQWVQQNISNFGGDPARVLLFGESAGANDTCILLASPLGAGLFSRALMESPICALSGLAARAHR
jgi:para-nitrobenzyl esterase